MVRRYETLLLAVPEITKDESSSLEKQVDQLIKKAKGSVISFERWGKYRLAYPIRKNDYGVYFLTRFEIDDAQSGELLHDLNALFAFKKADIIMRNMVTALEPGQSLSYVKPESLEDIPTRDVDSFLRENKMEGLISNKISHDKSRGSSEESAAFQDDSVSDETDEE